MSDEGLNDTDPEAARVHLELMRRAGPARRIHLALSLSQAVIGLSRGGIARTLEGASPRDIGLRFVALHYGRDLADALRAHLAARNP